MLIFEQKQLEMSIFDVWQGMRERKERSDGIAIVKQSRHRQPSFDGIKRVA